MARPADARGQIHGQAFDARRALGRRLRALADLADVDPDAHPRQIRLPRVELLQAKCHEHRSARGLEGEKSAVAGEVDDPLVALGRQPDELCPLAVEGLAAWSPRVCFSAADSTCGDGSGR